MGSVLVRENDDDELIVIDGQQRLVTISILLAVVRDLRKVHGDIQGSAAVAQKYLSDYDSTSKTWQSRILLNPINTSVYQEYIIEQASLDSIRQRSNLEKHVSNRRLLKAYIILNDSVNQGLSKSTDKLGKLAVIEQCVSEKLTAIRIAVSPPRKSLHYF